MSDIEPPEPSIVVHQHGAVEVTDRPFWWLPHLFFSTAALIMTVAVVLLVVLSLARARESDVERQRDECEALHNGRIYATGLESLRANNLLLVEITNQQLAGTFNRQPFSIIQGRFALAVLAEQEALDDYTAFIAAGRPVPCTIVPPEPPSSTVAAPPTIAPAPSTTRPTTTTVPAPTTPRPTTTTLPVVVTTTLAAAATTLRPSTSVRPPTPIPTVPPPTIAPSTSSTTTTTIDCPGNSEQCNRHRPGRNR